MTTLPPMLHESMEMLGITLQRHLYEHALRTQRFADALLLSLGKQREQRGMRAQKAILRRPFSRPPTPFVHASAPSRWSCGSHRNARLPLGSANPPRSSVSVSPYGCLAPPGCSQMGRSHRPERPTLPPCGPASGPADSWVGS